MRKFLASVPILAAAALAACSSYGPQSASRQDSPRVAKQEIPYRAGTGTVHAVAPAPNSLAGSGASAAATGAPMYRVEIWMDDGRIQWVDTDSRDYSKGQRVQLTEDRTIKGM